MNRLLYVLWNLNIFLESLPISSSGHIRLFQQYFKLPLVDSKTEHLMHIPNAFIIGAFLLYADALKIVSKSPTDLVYFLCAVGLTNVITGLAYLLLKNRNLFPLPLGFLISGCLLVSLAYAPNTLQFSITIVQAILIGCAQSFALLPGISRLAVTCSMGIWLGIAPTMSILFSLSCELALILIAAGLALQSQFVRARLQMNLLQCFGLFFVSGLSFLALIFVNYCFNSGAVVFFGWYLIGISLLSSFTFFLHRYTK